MELNLPEPLLAQFSDCLAARIGLHFPPDRWADLERGIGRAAPDLGFADGVACVRGLLTSQLTRRQIEILASHLTVGETYFFREPKTFEALEGRILPELIHSRWRTTRHLRFWSAACCTGEEAFSLAILLDRLLADRAEWQITILATDINPQFLQRASAGVYGEWSFRGVDPAIKERYFTKQEGGLYQLAPRIKAMVTFAYHNLVEDPFPALQNNTNAMDLVLCRNVLMYFSIERAHTVIRHLYCSLIDGGWLVPSAVEGMPVLFAPFVFTHSGEAIVYRKIEAAAAPPVSPMTLAEASATPVSEPPIPLPESAALPPQSRYEAAAALCDEGRYGEAAAAAAAHLAVEPGDDRAMVLLARTYANQGRLADALRWCTKAIEIDRLAHGKHYLLAMIHNERGDLEAAAASLKRALFLEPKYALAQFALANLTRLQGRHRESRRHYRNTVTLLKECDAGEILPDADGMTAGRLLEIVQQATLSDVVD